MRQRIFSRALALLLCLTLTMGTALAVVDPPANTYVGDYANVLSDSTEQYIIEKNDTLSAATGGAIVVVTVDFLDGLTIDDYAYQIFNDWGIGSASEKNGLLLLLAIGEDDYYALQGAGLESALPSSKLGDYLYDYLEAGFAAGDYDAGVRNVFDAFYGWYESYYGSLNTDDSQNYAQPNPGGSYYEPAPQAPVRRGGGLLTGAVVLLIVLVVIVVAAADSGRYRRYRRRYLLPGMPPPPRPYRPFLFGRPPRPPRPPRTPPPPRPPMGGGTRPPTGGGFNPGGFGGGTSRGGGAGRSSFGGASRSSGAGRSSFGGASRSSGAGRSSGGSRGGFGGGSSRGGGAGRRR